MELYFKYILLFILQNQAIDANRETQATSDFIKFKFCISPLRILYERKNRSSAFSLNSWISTFVVRTLVLIVLNTKVLSTFA